MGKKHKKHHKEKNNQDGDVEPTKLADQKPLKLVLKVGSGHCIDSECPREALTPNDDDDSDNDQEGSSGLLGEDASASADTPSSKDTESLVSVKDSLKLKKKKKKKKRKREHSDAVIVLTDVSSIKRQALDHGGDGVVTMVTPAQPAETEPTVAIQNTTADTQESSVVDTITVTEPPSAQDKAEAAKMSLMKKLDIIQKFLQKKDTSDIFAWPVTDTIAPGYSKIIQLAMDFSTMRQKIDNEIYNTIDEYFADFKLMCSNCMLYNSPDTIFYKTARKLLNFAARLYQKEKYGKGKLPVQGGSKLPVHPQETTELPKFPPEETLVSAMEVETPDNVTGETADPSKTTEDNKENVEEVCDGLTPDELLAQVQSAAATAKHKLTTRVPNSKVGFLRRDKDGGTSLAVVNPDPALSCEDNIPVNLGMLVGRVENGTGSLITYREEKRTKVTPVTYLTYGPFGTHCPEYDSSMSMLSKEESELLHSTYGDENGVMYAKSILGFAKDTGDFTMSLVDGILDSFTNGEHSKLKKQYEMTVEVKEEQSSSSTECSNPTPTSTEATPSSNTQGTVSGDPEFQLKLDKGTELLQELHQLQHERLSMKPPPHLVYIPGPSQREQQLASMVTDHLTELTKQMTPSDVVSAEAVRTAMGIHAPPGPDAADLILDTIPQPPQSAPAPPPPSLFTDAETTDSSSNISSMSVLNTVITVGDSSVGGVDTLPLQPDHADTPVLSPTNRTHESTDNSVRQINTSVSDAIDFDEFDREIREMLAEPSGGQIQ